MLTPDSKPTKTPEPVLPYDYPRSYFHGYWYCRKASWFWWRAAAVICFILGHKKEERYADCYRCG